MNPRKAFTLIELLIVIAIIALLAAILFPVFARARENARRSSCASNMKQIGLGLMQYTQDYDETYPRYRWAYNSGETWHQVIQPYLKSTQVFACPSNTASSTPLTVQAPAPAPQIPTSYGCNFHVMGGENAVLTRGVSLAAIEKPSQKIMVAEARDAGERGYANADWSSLSQFRIMGFAGHLRTFNILFCDGHVKAMRPTATMSDINMWGGFDDLPPATCTASDINCDVISNGALAKLKELENVYP